MYFCPLESCVEWYAVIVGTIMYFGLMWLFEMRFITQQFTS